MLVLGRKVGEKVVIGGNVVITIVERRGDRIRLGFEGPPEISIHREEVHRRIRREAQQECSDGEHQVQQHVA